MDIRKLGLWLLVILASHTTGSASEMARINSIRIIPVADGITPLTNLAPDGLQGMIVKGFRENGNAHAYNHYMVLLRLPNEPVKWYLATFDTHNSPPGQNSQLDTLKDQPHTGEDTVTTVKFAHATIDAAQATIAIIARRDINVVESIPEASPVQLEIYRLVKNPLEFLVGWPPYYFDLFTSFPLKGRYTNADCALAAELGLAMTKTERIDSGCP